METFTSRAEKSNVEEKKNMNKIYFVQYLPTKYPYLPVGDGFTLLIVFLSLSFAHAELKLDFYEKEFVY
jgi:hypothetical protein